METCCGVIGWDCNTILLLNIEVLSVFLNTLIVVVMQRLSSH